MKQLLGLFSLVTVLFGNCVYSQDGLSPAEFEKRINAQQPQLLDVRTASEYQSGHLKNSLQADWLSKEQFSDRIQYIDKSKPVLVYCLSGARSAAAAKYLQENGFTNVQNLKGGLLAWKQEGKPVEGTVNKPQLSNKQYKELSQSAELVLVDFGAEWCPPCKKMEPVLQQLQTDLPGKFTLIKVDGGIDTDVMKAQKVDALPVFVIYKNGKEVWRKQGVVALDELKKQLQ
ncbi:MAG: rhodanese-like domain-containing protein [Bacteroidota bacterium]